MLSVEGVGRGGGSPRAVSRSASHRGHQQTFHSPDPKLRADSGTTPTPLTSWMGHLQSVFNLVPHTHRVSRESHHNA